MPIAQCVQENGWSGAAPEAQHASSGTAAAHDAAAPCATANHAGDGADVRPPAQQEGAAGQAHDAQLQAEAQHQEGLTAEDGGGHGEPAQAEGAPGEAALETEAHDMQQG
jgi:hypothetical protein